MESENHLPTCIQLKARFEISKSLPNTASTWRRDEDTTVECSEYPNQNEGTGTHRPVHDKSLLHKLSFWYVCFIVLNCFIILTDISKFKQICHYSYLLKGRFIMEISFCFHILQMSFCFLLANHYLRNLSLSPSLSFNQHNAWLMRFHQISLKTSSHITWIYLSKRSSANVYFELKYFT